MDTWISWLFFPFLVSQKGDLTEQKFLRPVTMSSHHPEIILGTEES